MCNPYTLVCNAYTLFWCGARKRAPLCGARHAVVTTYMYFLLLGLLGRPMKLFSTKLCLSVQLSHSAGWRHPHLCIVRRIKTGSLSRERYLPGRGDRV